MRIFLLALTGIVALVSFALSKRFQSEKERGQAKNVFIGASGIATWLSVDMIIDGIRSWI